MYQITQLAHKAKSWKGSKLKKKSYFRVLLKQQSMRLVLRAQFNKKTKIIRFAYLISSNLQSAVSITLAEHMRTVGLKPHQKEEITVQVKQAKWMVLTLNL